MKRIIFVLSIVFSLCLAACGGGSGSSSSGSGSSSSDLSRYAGKWELFQTGNGYGQSATFTLKISSNGNASISHYAHQAGSSGTCLESGDGYAELNGDVLFVEITSGKSSGTTLRLIARDGRIYTADGQAFSKR